MSKQALADNFEEATWHNEYPMPDLNYIGKYVLSNAPKEHGVKVVLTGEGSDEHFAGYSIFLSDYLAEIDHSWPDYNLSDEERRESWIRARQASSYLFKIDDAAEKTAEEARNTASKQLNNVTTLSAMASISLTFSTAVSHSMGSAMSRTPSQKVSTVGSET